MSPLVDYVIAHSIRGECQCGKCADGVPDAKDRQPTGHTADLVFFKVAASNNPDQQTFEALVKSHKGEFAEVDPFDGRDHNYLELGAWIGDQGLAMQTMGLGALLGSWTLLTPRLIFGADRLTYAEVKQMAETGLLAIQVRKEKEAT